MTRRVDSRFRNTNVTIGDVPVAPDPYSQWNAVRRVPQGFGAAIVTVIVTSWMYATMGAAQPSPQRRVPAVTSDGIVVAIGNDSDAGEVVHLILTQLFEQEKTACGTSVHLARRIVAAAG
jgi:hypothetical protein